MTMGIERVLKEKFGDALKDIRQVFDEEVKQITVEVSEAPFMIFALISYSMSAFDWFWVAGSECSS